MLAPLLSAAERCRVLCLSMPQELCTAVLLFVFLQDFAKAGAGGAGMMFTFHLEACADPATHTQDTPHPAVVDMANKVKQAGMKVTTRTNKHCQVNLFSFRQ